MAKPLWQTLVAEPEERVLPWLGVRRVHERERTWQIAGAMPPEHGWYRFRIEGRRAELVAADAPPDDVEVGRRLVSGYLIGDRMVDDAAKARGDVGYLDGLVRASRRVWLIERGLSRFARVSAFEDRDGALVFVREELGLGPEHQVEAALQDGLSSVERIVGVPPALDLAFRWWVRQRQRAADERQRIVREAEEERQRIARAEEEERELAQLARAEAEEVRQVRQQMRAALREMPDGAARRRLLRVDVEAAARAALALSGAALLEVREAPRRGELIVSYRLRGERLQCVVDASTLRVIDAGVCLTDHATQERGDTYFTLESLPAVIVQAMDEGSLVVWRHLAD